MPKNIWKRLIYGNVSKTFYKDNREVLDKTNYRSVEIAYIFATFLFAALALVAKLYPLVADTWGIYSCATLVCGAMSLAVILWLPHHLLWTRVFYFLFELMAFGAAIMAGTYFSPDDLAVLFFLLLIILPLLYIERPIYSIAMSVIASIVFCVATYMVKGSDKLHLVRIDMLNAGFSVVICIVFIYYVRNMHLENIQAATILQVQSEMDGLTGVLNKVSTEKSCQTYLEMNGKEQNCALLILDIDEFKKVNDSLGHKQGDNLLKQIGYILKGNFREGDIIGRIGGDEFMVLLRNVHDTKIAELKADKIIREIAGIFSEFSTNHCGCSIGIATNKGQGRTFQEMYGKADHALYQAKEQGKGRYVVFSEKNVLEDNDLPVMLIVDDSEMSRAVLRTCFTDEYNILEAENGKEGLALIEKYAQRMNIVLLDLEMPVMNGYDVLNYMKKSERLRHIPILIITAHERNELMTLELGADDMIAKPYDPLIVKRRVANAIEKSEVAV